MDIVIIGSGIIGVSTAYYLSQLNKTLGNQIHLIESSPRFFASASGFAGGFLARDWFGPASASLGELSFDLHKQLAAQHDGRNKWGYSRSTTMSMQVDDLARKSGRRGEDWLFEGTSRAGVASQHAGLENIPNSPAWVTKQDGDTLDVISSGDSTAQLDPHKLCTFLLDACISSEVQVHQPAQAISVDKDASGELSSITVKSSTDGSTRKIPCSTILLSSGAWTPVVFRTLFPKSNFRIPISSLAGHHIVIRSPRLPMITPDDPEGHIHPEAEYEERHAVFSSIPSSIGNFSPEFFSRATGEIWFGGLNSSTLPLPELATDAKVQDKDIQILRRVARKILGNPDPQAEDDLEVLRTGLCFRPVTSDGTPILSRIDDGKLGMKTSKGGGVFLAVGHGPWGIALSLGTGKVMSEMLEGLETSADVSGLRL